MPFHLMWITELKELAMALETDGSIQLVLNTHTKNGPYYTPKITFDNTEKDLVCYVECLMRKVGLRPFHNNSLQSKKAFGKKPLFRVMVKGGKQLEPFLKELLPHVSSNRRKNQIVQILKFITSRKKNFRKPLSDIEFKLIKKVSMKNRRGVYVF